MNSPIIKAPCGSIQGFQSGHVYRFTGIRYASASRFEPPKPIDDWTEIHKANSLSPACPQPKDKGWEVFFTAPVLQGLSVDEDCQFLSITTPSTADIQTDGGEKLAVMVWFHGGAFVYGAADSDIYDPSRLVEEQRCIVVNLGSRLGLFGYLGDGSRRAANLGLLDALEGLRWIKRNISAFGGNDDPRSITLFGQSAGASTLADLMATADASSLFGRAIIQSAPFGITRGRDKMNTALLERVTEASASSSIEEIITMTQDVEVAGRAWGTTGGMPFAPQYGFAPLPPEAELETTLDATAPQIDVLVGSTAEEASMFITFIPWVNKASKLPLVGSFIHNAFVSYASRSLYHAGAKQFVDRHSRAGGKASLYTLKWASKDPAIGAMHAIELPLLFGSEKTWKGSPALDGIEWKQIDEDGKNLRKIWADFAKGKQVGNEDSVCGVIDIFSN